MEIFIEKSRKNARFAFKGTTNALLKKLGLNPETVIVTRDNALLTEEDILKDSDTVKILSVISGG